MSEGAHDAAGLPATLPATGGEPVTDAGGNAVTPSAGVTDAAGAAGESGSQAGSATSSGQQHQAAASQGGAQAAPGSQGSGASGSSSSSSSQPSSKWVPEQGHYEDVTEQVWVPNVVYTRHPRFYINHGGEKIGPFDSEDAAWAWCDNDVDNGGIGGSVIDDSYTTKEDQGRYETKVTGQRWVVDVPGYWE